MKQQISTITTERRTLRDSLARRVALEEAFARTGKSFRRNPGTEKLEHLFIKPMLKFGLSITGLYAKGIRNATQPVVNKLTLHYDQLPEAFDGYRVLQLSDLHLDSVDGLPEAVRAITRTLDIDLCLLTGDYRFRTEGPCDKVYAGMHRILSSISAPDGIFGILGNHDSSEMAYTLEGMGVQMLINDAVPVTRGSQSVWVAGIDDSYDFRCDDLPMAFAPIPANSFQILMAHTPDLYAEAARAGTDLYLCGHTHAGQVRLPWIGSVIQNSDAPRDYTHGHWNHEGMHGYTSAGIGCSLLPIRFNCPPEIVLLELRSSRLHRQ